MDNKNTETTKIKLVVERSSHKNYSFFKVRSFENIVIDPFKFNGVEHYLMVPGVSHMIFKSERERQRFDRELFEHIHNKVKSYIKPTIGSYVFPFPCLNLEKKVTAIKKNDYSFEYIKRELPFDYQLEKVLPKGEQFRYIYSIIDRFGCNYCIGDREDSYMQRPVRQACENVIATNVQSYKVRFDKPDLCIGSNTTRMSWEIELMGHWPFNEICLEYACDKDRTIRDY